MKIHQIAIRHSVRKVSATAALIANTSVSSTTDDKISKLFADVYAQLLKSLLIIEQREAPPAD